MTAPPAPAPAYAELQVTTNFSFLRGGSHPEEMAAQAAALGLGAIAVTDRNTLAGVVRAHVQAKEAGIKFVVGARLDLACGNSLLCFPTDRAAYGRLSRLLSLGRRRAPKGECELHLADLADHAEGQIVVALAPEGLFHRHPDRAHRRFGAEAGVEGARGSFDTIPPLREHAGGALAPVGMTDAEAIGTFLAGIARLFPGRAYLAAQCLHRGDDAERLAALAALAARHGLPLVATNDAHYHVPARRPLQDVLTCIREHCTLDEAGFRLFANAERHLKPPAEMAQLFRDHPEALARTMEIAGRIRFSLDELRYEYPVEPVPEGGTPQQELERLTWIGAARRYGTVSDKVARQLRHELALIGQLDYAPYFLTVYDIVREAKDRGIFCQGRGSAANSAVCFVLGITAVDPGRVDLLFERFVSAERKEPPDIDVDFEHERREEIIQYIYEKYGRDRAGLAATVISYRGRSAIREVGKALGLSLDTVDRLAKTVWGWGGEGVDEETAAQAGFALPSSPTRHPERSGSAAGAAAQSKDRVEREHGGSASSRRNSDPSTAPAPGGAGSAQDDDQRLRLALALARELIGFPRHLSQHVGGFVITKSRLDDVVPIENAAMENRTVVEWDKDDLDALGILKIDVLGLGMLTCIRKGFELIRRHYGKSFDLATVPAEDPAVYDMLCRADSIGVFQVESRAQMSMLPRLKPRNFYDLVIEVAIVRPGPIQGDMVHPYLRRREGLETVDYPSAELRQVLGKTLGVPLFQEQAMRIAIVAADFTPSEADKLRRAMATFRKTGTIGNFREKMIEGMAAKGYDRDFAQRCFQQIEGFGEYGFPESHAASFALLVYVSAWLKCHYPAVFAAALLNSQPMGFYAPAQIVRDARDHAVKVLPVDVNRSDWNNTLEPAAEGLALRLGFRQVKGLGEEPLTKLVALRGNGYPDPATVWRRTGLPPRTLERLAEADAFASMGLARREALWAVRILGPAPLPLFAAAQEDEQANDPPARLPAMTLGEEVVEDYTATQLSLKAHPLALLRRALEAQRVVPNAGLPLVRNGGRTVVAGLVLVRQRPGTAQGVIFMTLEDEGGICNVIVWPKTFERYRAVVMGARLVLVRGLLQREGLVTHVIADRIEDLSPLLDSLGERDAPVPIATARADEVARPNGRDPRDPEGKRRPRPHLLYPSRDFH
ncbi:MAG: error-prone DNA polymerase [Rhodospirillaceae bacterium]|nr:error-prone DNA polymerase [Rhodospirillaceae bacterium]